MASGLIRAQWFDRIEKPDWAPPNWSETPPLHLTVTDLDVGAVPHIVSWPRNATGNTAIGKVRWGDGLTTLIMFDHVPGMGSPIAHTYLAPGTYEIATEFGPGVSGTPALDAVTPLVMKQRVTVTEPPAP